MKNILKKLLIGASITVSMSAIASAPAHAGSITNVSIGGTNPSDYYVYDVDATGTKTVKVDSTQANLQKVLDGDATHPTGNVELAASSETGTFDFTKNTSLTGTIDGKDITLSSLTSADWFGPSLNTSYTADTLATQWFNTALIKAGFNPSANLANKLLAQQAFNTFSSQGGFQRFSDPNISYVNEDDTTGQIKIGLAGHYDAASVINASLGLSLAPAGFQVSELVKYTYNGATGYLDTFSATRSGLVADDGVSHTGNYEVSFQGVRPTPAATPEPSAMLGLLGVGGVFAAKRQLKKACTLSETLVSG